MINAFYLIVYNLWTFVKDYLNISYKNNIFTSITSQLLTFLSIVVSLVFFRSSDLSNAITYLKFLFGTNGLQFNDIFQKGLMGANPFDGLTWLIICSVIIFLLPNTQEAIFYKIKNKFNRSKFITKKFSMIQLRWKSNFFYLIIILSILVTSLMKIGKENEFIYFQF